MGAKLMSVRIAPIFFVILFEVDSKLSDLDLNAVSFDVIVKQSKSENAQSKICFDATDAVCLSRLQVSFKGCSVLGFFILILSPPIS